MTRFWSALVLSLPLVLSIPAAAASPVPPAAFQTALQRADDAGVSIPNDPVVQRALSHLTTRAPAFVSRGLARQPTHAALVDHALDDAGLPPLLRAVPLIESGYSNWGAPGSPESRSAAPGEVPGRGLWMFIPQTARAYGLQVDAVADERLDLALETDAAVTLLTDLHARYGDWGLALAAYNQGHRAVDAAIEAGGSRDVLRLIEAGLLNPYAARVMAGALLLESPDLLRAGSTGAGRR